MSLKMVRLDINKAKSYSNHNKLKITEAIIIEKGTTAGRPKVDLVCTDTEGEKYVIQITGTLIESLGRVVKASRENTGLRFKDVMIALDHFTESPSNGDNEEHTKNAMRAVYDLMS